MQKEYNTTAEFKQLFTRANIILTASCLKAQNLRAEADSINKRHKKISKWIEASNKKDRLIRQADQVESRGRRVWAATTNYQGKYVNWRNLTTEGDQIFYLFLHIGIEYDKNLNKAKKLAGLPFNP